MLGNTWGKGLLGLIALVFIGLFAYFWGDLLYEIWRYDPTTDDAVPTRSDAQALIMGMLATSVATGTAAVLGISIVEVKQKPLAELGLGSQPSRVEVGVAATRKLVSTSAVLVIGVLVYLSVGVLVIIAWFNNEDSVPQVLATFGGSALGWGLGAIAALFKASTTEV